MEKEKDIFPLGCDWGYSNGKVSQIGEMFFYEQLERMGRGMGFEHPCFSCPDDCKVRRV